MIVLYNARNNERLGEITEEQLQLLRDQMEEESTDDKDYYINQDTITVLQGAGADSHLLDMLQLAINDTGDADVRWSNE